MSYPRFIDFGKGINDQVNDPVNASNPLTYCVFPTVNAQFIHGSTSANLLYSPESPACQAFMTDYCSNKYDAFCETYRVMNVDTYWPNNAGVDVAAQSYANQFQQYNPTVGENMIRNVVHRSFILFPNKKYTRRQFDPNVANSPFISYTCPSVIESSIVINLSSPEMVNNNPHIKLMLENTRACFDVLARIYLAVARKEPNVNIKGTALEDFLQKNAYTFEKFLSNAVQTVTSFKGLTSFCTGCC
jgi:hypothetical protein